MYYPSLHPKPGDVIMAEHEAGWTGTVTDHVDGFDIGDTRVSIEFLDGSSIYARVSNDEFLAKVNGEEQHVHIDFISNIVGLADKMAMVRLDDLNLDALEMFVDG